MRHLPLLTIAIPTYNRSSYLVALLDLIINQLHESSLGKLVELLVVNNASTDNTNEVMKKYVAMCLSVRYIVNDENIGGDRNFIKCYQIANGEYVWLLGDDELIEPNAINTILSILLKKKCDYMLLATENNQYSTEDFNQIISFKSYIQHFANNYPSLLVNNTLISKNIIKKDLFISSVAEKKLKTNYAHMYGIAEGLQQKQSTIILLGKKVVTIRENRPYFSAPPKNLCLKMTMYLLYLAKKSSCYHLYFFAFKFYIFTPYRYFIDHIRKKKNSYKFFYKLYKKFIPDKVA